MMISKTFAQEGTRATRIAWEHARNKYKLVQARKQHFGAWHGHGSIQRGKDFAVSP